MFFSPENEDFMVFWNRASPEGRNPKGKLSFLQQKMQEQDQEQGYSLLRLLGLSDPKEEEKYDFYERIKKIGELTNDAK